MGRAWIPKPLLGRASPNDEHMRQALTWKRKKHASYEALEILGKFPTVCGPGGRSHPRWKLKGKVPHFPTLVQWGTSMAECHTHGAPSAHGGASACPSSAVHSALQASLQPHMVPQMPQVLPELPFLPKTVSLLLATENPD